MAYCTVEEVKAFLGVSGATDDALISIHVEAAQNVIDNYCHRTFEASADTTRYLDAIGSHITGRTLWLENVGELAAITTITNGDGIEVASGEYTTLPGNTTPYYAIKLLTSAGKVWTYSTDWEGAISIEGRWAFSTTPPDAIKQACVSLAAFYYRQKDTPFVDVTAVEAGVVVRPVGIPAYIKPLLMGYIKP